MNQEVSLPIWKTTCYLMQQSWRNFKITRYNLIKPSLNILARCGVAVFILLWYQNWSFDFKVSFNSLNLILFSMAITELSRNNLIHILSDHCRQKKLKFQPKLYSHIQYYIYFFLFYSVIIFLDSVPGPLQIAMWNLIMPIRKTIKPSTNYNWNIYNFGMLYIISVLLMSFIVLMCGILFLGYSTLDNFVLCVIRLVYPNIVIEIISIFLPLIFVLIGLLMGTAIDTEFSLFIYQNFPPYSDINSRIQRFIDIAT